MHQHRLLINVQEERRMKWPNASSAIFDMVLGICRRGFTRRYIISWDEVSPATVTAKVRAHIMMNLCATAHFRRCTEFTDHAHHVWSSPRVLLLQCVSNKALCTQQRLAVVHDRPRR